MLTSAELDRLCIVLVRSRNPLNIGAAARAMSNFGCVRLRVVHPYDVAFREARSAVDAEAVLTAAEEFGTVAESVADCSLVVGTTAGSHRNLREPLVRLESGAGAVKRALSAGSRVAILFGSEKVGLSNDDLSHCHLLLRVATRTEHASMNLGQAVAVVLYELVRQDPMQPASPPVPGELPATSGERELLSSLLLKALSLSGYVHRGSHPSAEERIRRLVGRLSLAQADAQNWLGLVRQLVWKLEGGTAAQKRSRRAASNQGSR